MVLLPEELMINSVDIQLEPEFDDERHRWFGDPVWVADGSPEALRKLVPQFERRPFSLNNPSPGKKSDLSPITFQAKGENELTDLIIRLPLNQGEVDPTKQDFGGLVAQFIDSEGRRCSVAEQAANAANQD